MSQGRLAEAMSAIDALHDQDPARVTVDGRTVARERLYAERMTAWLDRLCPDASDALQLAVRAQHLCRWKLPRGAYPEGRAGYKQWRSELLRRHGADAAQTAAAAGYPEDVCERVRSLIGKQGLRVDPEVQTLEDAACLTFLEHEYAAFAEKHDDDALVRIVTKTWKKMSAAAQAEAANLPFSGRSGVVLARALKVPAPPVS